MAGLCQGRVAIVTGAGGGLGRQHSLLLAKEGAKVVVNDIGAAVDGKGRNDMPAAQVVAEIKKMGGDAIVNGDDVSSWNGAKNLIDSTVKHFGKLDVLINNAGILRDRMLVNMTEDEWDAVIQVHLKGTFAPTRHAAAYWRERSKEIGGPVKAAVINTSSTSGFYGNAGQTNYGAAKAGIAAFSVIAARELKRIGVTVNALSPPRSEAGQRAADASAGAEDRGFRLGAADSARRSECGRPAGIRGHAGVHGAGIVSGTAGHAGQRRVRAGRELLPDADRPVSVSGRRSPEIEGPDSPRTVAEPPRRMCRRFRWKSPSASINCWPRRRRIGRGAGWRRPNCCRPCSDNRKIWNL